MYFNRYFALLVHTSTWTWWMIKYRQLFDGVPCCHSILYFLKTFDMYQTTKRDNDASTNMCYNIFSCCVSNDIYQVPWIEKRQTPYTIIYIIKNNFASYVHRMVKRRRMTVVLPKILYHHVLEFQFRIEKKQLCRCQFHL